MLHVSKVCLLMNGYLAFLVHLPSNFSSSLLKPYGVFWGPTVSSTFKNHTAYFEAPVSVFVNATLYKDDPYLYHDRISICIFVHVVIIHCKHFHFSVSVYRRNFVYISCVSVTM